MNSPERVHRTFENMSGRDARPGPAGAAAAQGGQLAWQLLAPLAVPAQQVSPPQHVVAPLPQALPSPRQVGTHLPIEQYSPVAQVCPHVPQFVESLSSAAQQLPVALPSGSSITVPV